MCFCNLLKNDFSFLGVVSIVFYHFVRVFVTLYNFTVNVLRLDQIKKIITLIQIKHEIKTFCLFVFRIFSLCNAVFPGFSFD